MLHQGLTTLACDSACEAHRPLRALCPAALTPDSHLRPSWAVSPSPGNTRCLQPRCWTGACSYFYFFDWRSHGPPHAEASPGNAASRAPPPLGGARRPLAAQWRGGTGAISTGRGRWDMEGGGSAGKAPLQPPRTNPTQISLLASGFQHTAFTRGLCGCAVRWGAVYCWGEKWGWHRGI